MRSQSTQHGLRHSATIAGLLVLGACGASFGSTGDDTSGGGPPLSSDPRAIPLEFTVQNSAASDRTETVRASVPFPQGGYSDLADVGVVDHPTAWQIMQRWPDGTVRMAQAQFTDTLPAGAARTYRVQAGLTPLAGAFTPNAWVQAAAPGLQIGADLQDTFHSIYRGYATGAGEVLQSSPLVQVRRHRVYHQIFAGPGIGRDYLTSTFYVTEFHDAPVLLVDWLLGNDYGGLDSLSGSSPDPNMHPLGVVDVLSAGFLVKGIAGAAAYRPVQEGIGAPIDVGGGLWLFPVMASTWLEDGQMRRYRFVLRFEDGSAPAAERDRWRTTADAMTNEPLYPLATLRTWQDTAGAGLIGGPIDGPVDATSRAAADYLGWNGAGHFGTWGTHGEIQHTGTTGTPRNTPLSPDLAHAIQGNYPKLLQKLEQLAWVQAMRPYHMNGIAIGAEQDVMLWEGVPLFPGSRDLSHETFGRRALWANDPWPGYRTLWVGQARAHGWEAYDNEHWSSDSLFDYWSISGDEWAKAELAQVGQCLKGVMRLRNAFTAGISPARAEGWCMQSFVQVYLATGDDSIKQYAMRRAVEIVDAQRKKTHPSRVLCIQGSYPQTGYPTPNEFFMPWQHGAVLYGYLGAYRHFNDPVLMRIAEDVATTVEYSWVHNFRDPYFGFVVDGLRYYVPFSYNGNQVPPSFWDAPPYRAQFGDSPLGGAHTFLIGGLYTLADWSPHTSVRARALRYAHLLWPVGDQNSLWDKWKYCTPLGRVPQ